MITSASKEIKKGGSLIGYICISVSKTYKKRDIIIVEETEKENPAKSMRSVTELINALKKIGLTTKDILELIDFVSKKLYELELEVKS